MPQKPMLFLLFVLLTSMSTFAQENRTEQLVKYITTAPDGSTAMTIYDDARANTMQLEAAHSFYKYQLLDTETNEEIFADKNQSNTCILNKLKIADGTYNIRLYTKNFIISSKVTIAAVENTTVAMND